MCRHQQGVNQADHSGSDGVRVMQFDMAYDVVPADVDMVEDLFHHQCFRCELQRPFLRRPFEFQVKLFFQPLRIAADKVKKEFDLPVLSGHFSGIGHNPAFTVPLADAV